MKTNKERVDIILKKYEERKSLSASICESNSEPVKPKKKVEKWKIVTAIVCTAIVVFGAILGIILGVKNSNTFDIDKMYIANFSKYQAIGMGYIEPTQNNASASTIKVASASSSSNNKKYLIGQTESGEIEKILFTKEKNGKGHYDIGGKIHLKNIKAFNNFTLLNYGNYESGNMDYFYQNKYNGDKLYLVDNKTGKIFDLKSLGEFVQINFSNLIYDIDGIESEDSLYLKIETSIYRIKVENENLKIEQVVDLKDLAGTQDEYEFYLYNVGYFVDKNNNLFIESKSVLINEIYDSGIVVSKAYPIRFRITNGYIFSENSDRYYLSINGLVYNYDNNKYFNEEGNLVSKTDNNKILNLKSENLIKREENIEYYYGSSHIGRIFKVTWQNKIEFTYDIISIDSATKFVTTKDYIYFCEDNKIFSVEIATGQRKDLVSDYIFSEIETDNLGHVIFKGKASNMDNITGIILNDGTIDISQTRSKYVVYYIRPLN